MKVAIAGAGKLGLSLTEVLMGGGNDVLLMDSREDVIRRAGETFDVMTVCGDARQASLLTRLGIDSYDMIIAATGDDEMNIFVCSLAKKLGCRMAVARVRGPEHADQLELIKDTFGVDLAVNPDLACGHEIYKYLMKNSSQAGGIFNVEGADVLNFEAERIPGLVGEKLREINALPAGSLITAVSRSGSVLIPNGNTQLQENDSLYVICPEGKADSLRSSLKKSGGSSRLKRVMIAGGGRTGYYLAKSLSEAGVSVKLIEMDGSRCEFLAENLKNVLVIHGSASDKVLLQNENLAGMDALVAATGSDETNILLSMLAQETGVENVVAKVSHNNFRQFAALLKDTMTINPVEMCVSEILNYAGRESSVLLSRMVQGQAEFLEILAEDGMMLTEKTLAELEIPEGVLIAGITRGGRFIIPSGSTKINAGDKVVIFSKLTDTGSVDSLIKVRKNRIAQG